MRSMAGAKAAASEELLEDRGLLGLFGELGELGEPEKEKGEEKVKDEGRSEVLKEVGRLEVLKDEGKETPPMLKAETQATKARTRMREVFCIVELFIFCVKGALRERPKERAKSERQ